MCRSQVSSLKASEEQTGMEAGGVWESGPWKHVDKENAAKKKAPFMLLSSAFFALLCVSGSSTSSH